MFSFTQERCDSRLSSQSCQSSHHLFLKRPERFFFYPLFRDPTLLHQICRDVRSLLHSVFKDVCLTSARFGNIRAPSSWFLRIQRSLHPTLGAVLDPFPFILRTSRNARCCERFSPRIRLLILAREQNL